MDPFIVATNAIFALRDTCTASQVALNDNVLTTLDNAAKANAKAKKHVVTALALNDMTIDTLNITDDTLKSAVIDANTILAANLNVNTKAALAHHAANTARLYINDANKAKEAVYAALDAAVYDKTNSAVATYTAADTYILAASEIEQYFNSFYNDC